MDIRQKINKRFLDEKHQPITGEASAQSEKSTNVAVIGEQRTAK